MDELVLEKKIDSVIRCLRRIARGSIDREPGQQDNLDK